MRLAVFGASGATGRHLVELALEAGHEVSAFVRDAGGPHPPHDRLRLVVGRLDQQEAMRSVIAGADVVVSVLGMRSSKAEAICGPAMRSILPMMKTLGVRRLIALSAYGASETRGDSLLIRLVRRIIAAKMRDKDDMEVVVRASGLDWTLVRPAVLTNGRASGHYRAGVAIKPAVSAHLSRADLAAFMLSEAEDARWMRQAPVVFSWPRAPAAREA